MASFVKMLDPVEALGNEIFEYLGTPVFGAFGFIDETNHVLLSGKPLGGELDDLVVGGIALGKFGELVAAGGLVSATTPLLITPTGEYELTLGYMGGVRYQDKAAAISGLPQEHDCLVAAMLLYAFDNVVQLHHVGWRYMTPEDARRMAYASAYHQQTCVIEPIPGNNEYYVPCVVPPSSSVPYGIYYKEYRYVPFTPDVGMKHIDVITNYPEDLLRFVAQALGQEATLYGSHDRGPYGEVGEVAAFSEKHDAYLILRARRHDWKMYYSVGEMVNN